MFKLLFLCFLSAFASCDDKKVPETEQPEIVLSDSLFVFDYTASSKVIEVSSNVEWGISSSEDWVSFSPSGGLSGKTTLTVSLKENKEIESRNSTLTFKSGTYKKEFLLKQNPDPDRKEPEIIVPTGYKLVWHDEFDQSRLENGKTPLPDKDNWWFETGDGGWGNNEIQNYIAGNRGADTCAIVSNGTLKIIAKKVGREVLSIRMNTVKNWTYGYFEARLKLPIGKGTWPAFWMMPANFTAWPDDGEIDIMEEVGYHPNYVSSSIHTKAYNHSINTQKTAEVLVPTAQTEFHVYALEWTDSYIYGFVDGVCHFRFMNDKKGDKKTWPFYSPFYLKLNLAWGGNWGGQQGLDDGCLPAKYEIDYVRVFQKL